MVKKFEKETIKMEVYNFPKEGDSVVILTSEDNSKGVTLSGKFATDFLEMIEKFFDEIKK